MAIYLQKPSGEKRKKAVGAVYSIHPRLAMLLPLSEWVDTSKSLPTPIKRLLPGANGEDVQSTLIERRRQGNA